MEGLNTKIILKGQGFRGGSNEKMMRMWLGREIVVVGLHPLQRGIILRGGGKGTVKNQRTVRKMLKSPPSYPRISLFTALTLAFNSVDR